MRDNNNIIFQKKNTLYIKANEKPLPIIFYPSNHRFFQDFVTDHYCCINIRKTGEGH